MDMDLNIVSNGQFTNYSASSVTIQGSEYADNIMVFENTVSDFMIKNVQDLALDSLDKVIQVKPDLIIFGTGNKVVYPDFKLLEKLNRSGIGFEVMPIPALCRTYNFLISEDRRVLCILFFDVS